MTISHANARSVNRAVRFRYDRRQRGFTLFEMVVAVSIFALMGVIAFGALGEMTRNGQSLADSNDRLSDVQFAVVYFNRDWTQVSPRKIRNQYGDEENNVVIEDDVITFTRSGWSNLIGHKRSNLQRVQYFVRDEKLVRRYWVSIDQGIGEEAIEMVMLDDVKSLEVALRTALDKQIRAWPGSDQSGGGPVLLEFKLELADMGEITRLLEVPDGVL